MQSHLHIAGKTKQPETLFTVSPSNRKKLYVCMGMMYGLGSALVELTGTKYAGCAERKTYTTVTGDKECDSLGAYEYIDAVASLLNHFYRKAPSLRKNPNFAIMHDNAKPHIANLVTKHFEKRGIKVVIIPTRSPDMDPWDYGVFGSFKQVLFRDARKRKMSWDDLCQEAVRRLQTLNSAKLDNAISQLPLRLQACIDEKGCHIENRLVEMKRKSPALQHARASMQQCVINTFTHATKLPDSSDEVGGRDIWGRGMHSVDAKPINTVAAEQSAKTCL